MVRRSKEEARATRERVLMAALNLFAEKGYARTTCADIGKRIGMTRGAVYWHFDNKADLLAALIDHCEKVKSDVVSATVSDIWTVADLREAFVLSARALEQNPMLRKFEFFVTYQMEWSEALLAETHEKLSAMKDNPMRTFRNCFEQPALRAALRDDVDVDALIVVLASLWVGASKIYFGHRFSSVALGHCAEGEMKLFEAMNFEKSIADGFDLVMNTVLKERESA